MIVCARELKKGDMIQVPSETGDAGTGAWREVTMVKHGTTVQFKLKDIKQTYAVSHGHGFRKRG